MKKLLIIIVFILFGCSGTNETVSFLQSIREVHFLDGTVVEFYEYSDGNGYYVKHLDTDYGWAVDVLFNKDSYAIVDGKRYSAAEFVETLDYEHLHYFYEVESNFEIVKKVKIESDEIITVVQYSNLSSANSRIDVEREQRRTLNTPSDVKYFLNGTEIDVLEYDFPDEIFEMLNVEVRYNIKEFLVAHIIKGDMVYDLYRIAYIDWVKHDLAVFYIIDGERYFFPDSQMFSLYLDDESVSPLKLCGVNGYSITEILEMFRLETYRG